MPPLNVLLITTDQQHHSTIGAFNPTMSTPSLDRLVRDGSTFERGYCANPTLERSNLWDAPEHGARESELLLRCVSAELGKEPMWMPRVSRA
jgi:hypothetical protein